MFLLVLRHVWIVKDALQVAVNAGGWRLQFMGSILSELALDAYLFFLRMTELPIEHDDGVADVTQLVIGQTSLQFVVERLALFSLHSKLAQIADVTADAMGT